MTASSISSVLQLKVDLFLFYFTNSIYHKITEKYFEMNKKQCKDALDFYKKFLVRMDRVAEFLKVAENVGIDKGDIPDLTRVRILFCKKKFFWCVLSNLILPGAQ